MSEYDLVVRGAPLAAKQGRYQPTDSILTFLDNL